MKHRPGAKHGNADGLSRARKHPQVDTCPACNETVKVLAITPRDDLRRHQMSDADVQLVSGALTSGDPEPVRSQLSSWGLRLLQKWASLEIRNGVLGIELGSAWKPVIPRALVLNILEELHEGLGGGHFGIKKLTNSVQARFWWPEMRQDISAFVQGCSTCATAKDPSPKPKAALVPITASRPFQTISLDFVGPLPATSSGNAHALSIVDMFTKWAEVVPCPDQSSNSVIHALMFHWIPIYGVPEAIHSDQGAAFESADFRNFCASNRIRKTRTSAYHPSGNGQCERFNRTLRILLATHVVHEPEWDQYVPLCMTAYRAAVHEGTGFSPHQLVFGRSMTLPLDNIHPSDSEPNRPGVVYLKLKARLASLHQKANKNLRESQTRNKNAYDPNRLVRTYSVGQGLAPQRGY